MSRQAQFIFVTLRAAILAFPAKYARQMVAISSEHEARLLLEKAAREFLCELADFPNPAISPDWLATLEADGEPQPKTKERPATKAEQQKAKRLRRKKTETMRRLRARKR